MSYLEGIGAWTRERLEERRETRSLAAALLRCRRQGGDRRGQARLALAGRDRARRLIRRRSHSSTSADGAAAISVLTSGRDFGGSYADLAAVRAAVDLPVLCKDFFVDVWQVTEARVHGADAILVLLALVEDNLAADLIQAAEDLEMEALVEVHNGPELERALDLGTPIIGVNARDLATLEIDRASPDRAAAPPAARAPAHRGVGHRDARTRHAPCATPARTRCSSGPRSCATPRCCRRSCGAARDDRQDLRRPARRGRGGCRRGRGRHGRDDLLGGEPALRERGAGPARARGRPAGRAARRRVRRRGSRAHGRPGRERRPRPHPAARLGVARAGRALRRACDPRRARRRSLGRASGRAGRLRPALGRDARRRGAVRALARGQPASSPTGSSCWPAASTPTTSRRPCARCAPTASTSPSGVESSAGIKDHELVRRFIAAAKEAT